MPDRTPLTSPQTSHDAATQLDGLAQELDDRRRTATRLRAARDAAETLYRREKAKAQMLAEGRNADERAAWVELCPLDDRVIVEGHAVAVRLWGDASDVKPDNVGDLRWLRDRAEGMADGTSAAAYDARDKLKAWVMVASMSKSEAEFSDQGRPLRAVEGGGR